MSIWRSIQLVSFRFVSFRFVSICFVSFRFVSFRFDMFRFVPFRFCFVSHFTGTLLCEINQWLTDHLFNDEHTKGSYCMGQNVRDRPRPCNKSYILNLLVSIQFHAICCIHATWVSNDLDPVIVTILHVKAVLTRIYRTVKVMRENVCCIGSKQWHRQLWIIMPPSKKEGHIALHMSVCRSVGRYVGLP